MSTTRQSGAAINVGANLRKLRTRQKKTQQQLADASGIGRVTIAEIESQPGRSPRMETLEALAGALGVSIQRLLAPQRDTSA